MLQDLLSGHSGTSEGLIMLNALFEPGVVVKILTGIAVEGQWNVSGVDSGLSVVWTPECQQPGSGW
jgi:hypothetical protein